MEGIREPNCSPKMHLIAINGSQIVLNYAKRIGANRIKIVLKKIKLVLNSFKVYYFNLY